MHDTMQIPAEPIGTVEYFDCISANKCPNYVSKQSDGEAPVMLWGRRRTPSSLSLPGPLWLGVVALERVLSMGKIELFHI